MRDEESATLLGANSRKASVRERRRPGRIENVSTELLPLYRDSSAGRTAAPANNESVLDTSDDLAPARGIFLGGIISLVLWILIAFVARWLI
jgi:hypothetical protein